MFEMGMSVSREIVYGVIDILVRDELFRQRSI